MKKEGARTFLTKKKGRGKVFLVKNKRMGLDSRITLLCNVTMETAVQKLTGSGSWSIPAQKCPVCDKLGRIIEPGGGGGGRGVLPYIRFQDVPRKWVGF